MNGGRHPGTSVSRWCACACIAMLAVGGLAAAPARDADAHGYVDAMTWYDREARNGNPEAQYLLGYALENGVRGAVDAASARRWYEASARAGHPRAAFRFAVLLLEGRGGDRDEAAARLWLERAAGDGVPEAMSLLGFLLATRDEDRIAAYRWLARAADAGDGAAAANLAALAHAMTVEEVAEAEAVLED